MKQEKILNHILKKIDNYPRYYYVFWFFIMCFFIIISSVFSYTVKNYDFYKQLADKQQIWESKNPSTRWTIFSSTNSWTVLWTSVNLNDLAIDPTVKWDKTKLASFLTNIVYKHTCYLKTDKICYDNILKFLKKLEIENFTTDEKYLKTLISESLKEKISRTSVTSILLTNDIDDSKLSLINSLWLKWVYSGENSLYVNPEEIDNIEFVSEKIYKLVWMDKYDLKEKLKKRELKYIPIINKMSIWLSEEIDTYIDWEKDAIKKWLSENNSISNFFILDSNNKRYFPEDWLASQIIWFVDNNWEWHYW
jgi:cell division protein FtsI/penicillin-binding protein 2